MTRYYRNCWNSRKNLQTKATPLLKKKHLLETHILLSAFEKKLKNIWFIQLLTEFVFYNEWSLMFQDCTASCLCQRPCRHCQSSPWVACKEQHWRQWGQDPTTQGRSKSLQSEITSELMKDEKTAKRKWSFWQSLLHV